MAIKVLAKQDEEAANRLLQEAQAASALDHPNICTIYEIDETPEGQMFIAMGYGVGLPRPLLKFSGGSADN